MSQYQISLNCKIEAEDESQAKLKALDNIQIKEALPMALTPLDVYTLLRRFHKKKKEFFIALFLDTQNQVLAKKVISMGTLNSSLIHPRELFSPALKLLAASVLVAHNHPSGQVRPSDEDVQVTKRLVDAGRILGVEILDHLVFSKSGFYSFKENNNM
jgi:DNA repair protein RadC